MQLELFDYRRDYLCDFKNQIAHYYDILKETKDTWVKIPSHESYNFKLIKFALENFKKVIRWPRCLKESELTKLIKFISSKKKYKNKTSLLHCVSSYPLKPDNCNFAKFKYIKNFKVS